MASYFPPLGPATSLGSVFPEGWDRATLGGSVIPGHCKVVHGSCKLKRDAKGKKGADGANPTYNGMDPQPLQLEIMTYSDEDRELLAKILKQHIPKPGQKPKSVSFDHPSTRLIGLTAVDVIGAGALIPEPGTSKAKMVLDMVHSMPAKKANASTTPTGAPVRKPKNNRKKANPLPTENANFSAPPEYLQSGG